MFATRNDPLTLDANQIYSIFGRCEMMEGFVMDWIINYWKDSPHMKRMFENGERVLLTPNTIPVSFWSIFLAVSYVFNMNFLNQEQLSIFYNSKTEPTAMFFCVFCACSTCLTTHRLI